MARWTTDKERSESETAENEGGCARWWSLGEMGHTAIDSPLRQGVPAGCLRRRQKKYRRMVLVVTLQLLLSNGGMAGGLVSTAIADKHSVCGPPSLLGISLLRISSRTQRSHSWLGARLIGRTSSRQSIASYQKKKQLLHTAPKKKNMLCRARRSPSRLTGVS